MSVTRVTKRDGTIEPFNGEKHRRAIRWAAHGLNLPEASLEALEQIPMYEEMPTAEVQRLTIVSAAERISATEPEWSYMSARLLLQMIYKFANEGSVKYPHISTYLQRGIDAGRLSSQLMDPDQFDLDAINKAIDPSRDLKFQYLGLQTLADRYFIRNKEGTVIELPQFFWMRVAMGVALDEPTKEMRTHYALEYYNQYSDFRDMNSTPTLFNSGTVFPQLSSCFGHFMDDDTDAIFDCLRETANYSKFAGGDSISVTPIRAHGSKISSTGGRAGGPIPYLKMYNDTLIGFDQSGKRKGSGAVYMEPWHADIEAFLDLREPGDERGRAHDLFPALWIPDEFMRRVEAKADWSLFDPKDVPMLHEVYDEPGNKKFTQLYKQYEEAGLAKRTMPAVKLWQKILTRAFQHGTWWPCFKDTSNARYMQKRSGTVHHSNLCTEILLRDGPDISFVCNLGSINLAHQRHLLTPNQKGGYEWNSDLEKAVRLKVRNLDSVISVGFVPHERGTKFQNEDRAIGLGAMGEAQAIQMLGIPYDSVDHVKYAFEVWRQISLTAIHESALLARERGTYPKFSESLWADGVLPPDTLTTKRILDFGLAIELDTPFATESELRDLVKGGMRNSELMAIAPTATIANITGVLQSHELPWELVSHKENLSGIFKVIAPTVVDNPYGLPTPCAKDVDQRWSIWCAAARQVWIDQSQSLNSFYDPNEDFDSLGDRISANYFESWRCGVKTNYYLYSRASESEPQTLNKRVERDEKAPTDAPTQEEQLGGENWTGGRVCSIDAGPDCEACQ